MERQEYRFVVAADDQAAAGRGAQVSAQRSVSADVGPKPGSGSPSTRLVHACRGGRRRGVLVFPVR